MKPRIACPACIHLVHSPDGVELRSVLAGGDSLRSGQVQDRFALSPQQNSLVDRRQVTRSPRHRPRHGTPLIHQRDEAWQILRFTPQSIGQPCPQARPAGLIAPRQHLQLTRSMIERAVMHRADQPDVVGTRPDVRQQF